jgi:hypothetical protein
MGKQVTILLLPQEPSRTCGLRCSTMTNLAFYVSARALINCYRCFQKVWAWRSLHETLPPTTQQNSQDPSSLLPLNSCLVSVPNSTGSQCKQNESTFSRSKAVNHTEALTAQLDICPSAVGKHTIPEKNTLALAFCALAVVLQRC